MVTHCGLSTHCDQDRSSDRAALAELGKAVDMSVDDPPPTRPSDQARGHRPHPGMGARPELALLARDGELF